ncbi:2-(1,2-epoxy-1,2-dihydrophenyl)acetyl-CoA isomerase [Sphingomonas zeicaulis]|uniref:enoyl-CoA hydratase-related protein n=1 Tax=Sphingomonas zeicaulis TaxID=1632740 RepID=UPI003D23D04B
MSDALILYAVADDIATIRLNRPDRLNAITPDLLDDLRRGFQRAVSDGARAVLITGEGRAFCSGAELGDITTGIPDLGQLLETHYHPLVELMASLPIPIVSAINGPAAGAGASLALSGDIIVMARSAYLLLAFANIGLVPDAGATWLIAKGAGRAKVLEMALLGERMSAEDARDAGLVTRVVDDEALLETAQALAAKLAAMPTLALGMIRKQVGVALDGTLTETLAVEAANQHVAGRSADFLEGVLAFTEKRKPEFKGR